MRLFISTECMKAEQNDIPSILSELHSKLNFVTKKGIEKENNYGEEFEDIGVIFTCIDNEFWENMQWKERRLVSRKRKEADIRLRIDYDRFINSSYEIKRLLVIDNIVKSIEVVISKSKGDFKGEQLINDILKALEVDKDDLNRLSDIK